MISAPEHHPFIDELNRILDRELIVRSEAFDGIAVNYAVMEIRPNGHFHVFGWAQITLFGEDGETAYGYFLPADPSRNPEWMHLRRSKLWPMTDKTPPTGALPPVPPFSLRIPAAPEED